MHGDLFTELARPHVPVNRARLTRSAAGSVHLFRGMDLEEYGRYRATGLLRQAPYNRGNAATVNRETADTYARDRDEGDGAIVLEFDAPAVAVERDAWFPEDYKFLSPFRPTHVKVHHVGRAGHRTASDVPVETLAPMTAYHWTTVAAKGEILRTGFRASTSGLYGAGARLVVRTPELKVYRVSGDTPGSGDYARAHWRELAGYLDAIVVGRPGHESELVVFDPARLRNVRTATVPAGYRRGTTSAAWISPDGHTYDLGGTRSHGDFAADWLARHPGTPVADDEQGWRTMLRAGWLRVSNFLSVDTYDQMSTAAAHALVEFQLAAYAANAGEVHGWASRWDDPEQHEVQVFDHRVRQFKNQSLPDFIRHYAGAAGLKRLYGSLPVTRTAAGGCHPNDVSMAWVQPDGTVHDLAQTNHDHFAQEWVGDHDNRLDVKEALNWGYRPTAILLRLRWVRVSNFQEAEATGDLPHDAGAAIAEMLVPCLQQKRRAGTDLETLRFSVYRSPSQIGKEWATLDFIRHYGGERLLRQIYGTGRAAVYDSARTAYKELVGRVARRDLVP